MGNTKVFNNVMIGQKAFIVSEQGKILIMKRKDAEVHDKVWDIPGGRVEVGQSLREAIIREVKEETNLVLDEIILTLMSSTFKALTKGHPLFYRTFYVCSASGKFKLSNEHSEYKWIGKDEIDNYSFQPDEDFNRALNKLKTVLPSLDLQKTYSDLI